MADTVVLHDSLNPNKRKLIKNQLVEIVTHDELCKEGKLIAESKKEMFYPIVKTENEFFYEDCNYGKKDISKDVQNILNNKIGVRFTMVQREKMKQVDAQQAQSEPLSELLQQIKEEEEYAMIMGIRRVHTSEQLKIQHLNKKKETEKYKTAKFKCDKCALIFFTKNDQQTHVKSRHCESIGPHECIVCHCRFKSPVDLSHHNSLEHSLWACGRCEAILMRDQWPNHGIKCSFEGHECDICHKKYSSKMNLRRHRSRHTMIAVNCPVCDKHIVNKSLLRHHMQRHTGLKLYECDLCDMKYSTGPGLWEHKKIKHGPTKQEPLEARYCKECDKHLASKTSLDNHLKSSIHVDKNLLKYSCDFCPKKFSSSTGKQIHMEQHHKDAKNHKCHICPKEFSTKLYLNSHIRRTHNKSDLPRNFRCDLCGAAFLRKKALIEHIKAIHEKLRLHKCQTCGAKFGFSSALYNHNRLKHTVMPKFKLHPENTISASNTEVHTAVVAVDEA